MLTEHHSLCTQVGRYMGTRRRNRKRSLMQLVYFWPTSQGIDRRRTLPRLLSCRISRHLVLCQLLLYVNGDESDCGLYASSNRRRCLSCVPTIHDVPASTACLHFKLTFFLGLWIALILYCYHSKNIKQVGYVGMVRINSSTSQANRRVKLEVWSMKCMQMELYVSSFANPGCALEVHVSPDSITKP